MIKRSNGKHLQIGFEQKILVSDEKFFDIDDVYNSQNDRVWAVDRADTDKRWYEAETRVFTESNGLVGCLFHGHNAFSDSR